MPSTIIGRVKCPECGNPAAHVKRADKEGAKAYRYCPEHTCGAQYFPRTAAAEQRLLASMRPEGTPPAPAPAPTPAPAPARSSGLRDLIGL